MKVKQLNNTIFIVNNQSAPSDTIYSQPLFISPDISTTIQLLNHSNDLQLLINYLTNDGFTIETSSQKFIKLVKKNYYQNKTNNNLNLNNNNNVNNISSNNNVNID